MSLLTQLVDHVLLAPATAAPLFLSPQPHYTRVCSVPTPPAVYALSTPEAAILSRAASETASRISRSSSASSLSSVSASSSTDWGSHSPTPSGPPSPRTDCLPESSAHFSHVADVAVDGVSHQLMAARLSYPDTWRAPSGPISPFHVEAEGESEQEVLGWLELVLGAAVVDKRMQKRTLALAPAKWSALLLPMAGDEYRLLLARFLALAVIIDDAIIEQAHTLHLSATQLAPYTQAWRQGALRKQLPSAATELRSQLDGLAEELRMPIVSLALGGLMVLCDEYVSRGADALWCERMADRWEEFMELGIREARGADSIHKASSATGRDLPLPPLSFPLSTFDDPAVRSAATGSSVVGPRLMQVLIRQRVASIALPMLAMQLERACGLSLPKSVDSLLQPLVHLVALAAAIVNETVGLGRDLGDADEDGEQLASSNLLLVHRRVAQTTLADSVSTALELHDGAVAMFDIEAARAVNDTDARLKAKVGVYLNRLRHLTVGYAAWHGCADRYKSRTACDVSQSQLFVFHVHADEKSGAIYCVVQ